MEETTSKCIRIPSSHQVDTVVQNNPPSSPINSSEAALLSHHLEQIASLRHVMSQQVVESAEISQILCLVVDDARSLQEARHPGLRRVHIDVKRRQRSDHSRLLVLLYHLLRVTRPSILHVHLQHCVASRIVVNGGNQEEERNHQSVSHSTSPLLHAARVRQRSHHAQTLLRALRPHTRQSHYE